MADTKTPDRCQCGEDHGHEPSGGHTPAPTPAEAAFYDAMVRHLMEGHAPISPEFLAGAITGYTLRRHVNEAHPDRVAFAFEKSCPAPDMTGRHAGWVFGYRYEGAP